MKKFIYFYFLNILSISFLIFFIFTMSFGTSHADDTCMFEVTANDVPPNITILFDNGSEMEQIYWHTDYDDSMDYTPPIADINKIDVVPNGSSGNGFFKNNGYGIVAYYGNYYLTNILNDLTIDSYINGIQANSSGFNVGTWTINGKTLTLTSKSNTWAVNGIIDNAANIRFSKNYLNWLFFNATGALELDSVAGTFQDGETLTGSISSGSAKVFGTISGGVLRYDSKSIDFQIGDEVSGGVSGAIGTVVSILQENAGVFKLINITGTFQNNETLTGGTSGATALVVGTLDPNSSNLLNYDTKSGNFLRGEVITGGTSGATATIQSISSYCYSGNGSDLPHISRFYMAKKALFNVLKLTENRANFGIFYFTGMHGATLKQGLSKALNTPLAGNPNNNVVNTSFTNNINSMQTYTYSPLAEGVATIGEYYSDYILHVVSEYCQKNFIIVLSAGISSMDTGYGLTADQIEPDSLLNYDGDGGDAVATGSPAVGSLVLDGVTHNIVTNITGSTYLDDVAYYLNTHDIVGYQDGYQNIYTYTIGFLMNERGTLFLINTSNNGNGNVNLTNSADPEYGKYHFTVEYPEDLCSALMDVIDDIISRTSTFTAPLVPISKTMSSDKIYMTLFKPSDGNFWEGNVVKFGLSSNNEIIDINNNVATYSNGALKENAVPYWQTKDWANISNFYNSRTIYTCIGSTLTVFITATLNSALLGNPTHTVDEIVKYIRGADVFDEDLDGIVNENRQIITGDVLHSSPVVLSYDSYSSMVYFGSNDGMLHAVKDPNGLEAWAFIPPDLLPRLKDIIEGSEHQYFVDSSPKVYIKNDNGDNIVGSGEQAILVCGLGKGGRSYFALDVTNPYSPQYLWRIDPNSTGFSNLGETWSEPTFGVVKTTDTDTTGTAVLFFGGGYSSDNSEGNAIYAAKVSDGSLVKAITNTEFCFPSSVKALDTDMNGFIDKVYVGDLGGQMWRFGEFSGLTFPEADENIMNWDEEILFCSDPNQIKGRKFFYPPNVVLENGFDVVFMGTGNREDACTTSNNDAIYCVKDTHNPSISLELTEDDLVNVTDPNATPPNIKLAGDVDLNGSIDQGWYINLHDPNKPGEKVL